MREGRLRNYEARGLKLLSTSSGPSQDVPAEGYSRLTNRVGLLDTAPPGLSREGRPADARWCLDTGRNHPCSSECSRCPLLTRPFTFPGRCPSAPRRYPRRPRRRGRAAECSRLESDRPERDRGFKSLRLRFVPVKICDLSAARNEVAIQRRRWRIPRLACPTPRGRALDSTRSPQTSATAGKR